jgi:hypothetical protein
MLFKASQLQPSGALPTAKGKAQAGDFSTRQGSLDSLQYTPCGYTVFAEDLEACGAPCVLKRYGVYVRHAFRHHSEAFAACMGVLLLRVHMSLLHCR